MIESTAPHLVFLDMAHLVATRDEVRSGSGRLLVALRDLREAADELLAKQPTSVVDKTEVPPSGDKHDFYAIGAYSWPNPDTPDGLPYVRRDGRYNPEAYASPRYDKGRFQVMVEDVKLLSLAHFYLDDRAYARHAESMLRTWFIESGTRMNPNLRHAAVQPGVNDGRHSGVIEGVILLELLDHIELLAADGGLSPATVAGLRSWFLQFSHWLVSSAFGRAEIHSTNNHGSYYLAQVMAFAAFGGNHARAQSVIPLVKRQIDRQFAPDGSMPREIDRPNAFFYSIYGLRAFVVLARLCDRYGVDLWHYRPRGRRSPAIVRSLHFLAPYLTGEEPWRGRRLDKGFSPYALQMCRMAGRAYASSRLGAMVTFLASRPEATHRFDVLVGEAGVVSTAEGDALFGNLPAREPSGIADSAIAVRFRRLTSLLARKGLLPAPGLL